MSPGDPAWERVEELFHRALELPPEDRHASLAGEEPGVAAAVRRLLRGADVATGFLQTSTSVAEEPSLGVGDQVGAWRVDAWLDGGGMGEVYRVTRASGDYEQAAALKLMRRRPDPSRFVRERQLLARLEHPNIARLIDGGESGGRQFMVVELVDGEAITESCLRRNTPERARLELFLQLCAAVAHAHGRLVLHRDIKPSNVLVTAQGEVKLVDFGVAHSLDAVEGDLRAPLTVAYAAPEQLAGDPVSTATDVYAMGLVLEELLAGRRRGRRPGSAEADGVADGPQVQVDLRAILSRALESDPSRRYPSAEALAEDVRRYLTRRPVMARRGGRLYRAGLLLSRYRVAATALGLLALSLALGWWTSARSADRERDAARRAQSALAAAEAAQREQSFEARTLEGYRRSLQVLSADPAVDGGGPVDLGERLVALADSASGPFLDGSVRDGYLIYSIGQHFMHRYDFARAARVLGVFGQVPLDASGGDVDLLLEARSDLARAWHELGRGAEAAALARRLLEERRRRGLGADLGAVQEAMVVADVSGRVEDRRRADAEIGGLIERLEPQILGDAGEGTTAEGHEAAAIVGDPGADDLGDLSWLYNQLGTSLLAQGEYGRAATVFTKEFELTRRLGEESPSAIVSATNWAQLTVYVLSEGQRVLRLLPDYREMNDRHGGDPRTSAFIDGLLAEAALLEGEVETAERSARRAVERLDGDDGFRGGWRATAVTLHARALARLGRDAAARAALTTVAPLSDALDSEFACRFRLARLELLARAPGADASEVDVSEVDAVVNRCRAVSAPLDELPPGLALAAAQAREAFGSDP